MYRVFLRYPGDEVVRLRIECFEDARSAWKWIVAARREATPPLLDRIVVRRGGTVITLRELERTAYETYDYGLEGRT